MIGVVTYNTYQERRGRDRMIDTLTSPEDTPSPCVVCLQEVKPMRALSIWRKPAQSHVSIVKSGMLYLATVVTGPLTILRRYTVWLNGHYGVAPDRSAIALARDLLVSVPRRPAWSDPLEVRAAQITWISEASGSEYVVINTHMPYLFEMRVQCLRVLKEIVRGLSGDRITMIVAGDFNTSSPFKIDDFCTATRLRRCGTDDPTPTHEDGFKIDYIMHTPDLIESTYSVYPAISDHRVVAATLTHG